MAPLKRRGYITPFGLNRYALLAWYTFVVGLTGYLVGGVDGFRQLLWMHGTGRSEADKNVLEQKATIESIVNVGFSFGTLLSLPVARFTAWQSPRITGLAAMAAFCFGMLAMFTEEDPSVAYAGIILVAASFSASFNAHVTLTALFPAASDIVFDCIGAAPDFSTIVPMVLYWIALNVESEAPVETTIQFFVGFLAIITIIHFFMLPNKPLSASISKKFATAMAETPKAQHPTLRAISRAGKLERFGNTFRREQDEAVVLNDLTLIQQLVHPLYWLIIASFTINLFRRYYVLSTFRYTCERYAEATGLSPEYASIVAVAMVVANAFSWIPTILLSRIFADLGTLASSMFLAFTGVIGSLALCIPNLHVQWISVAMVWLSGSIMHGNLYTWIADYFGFRYMPLLQGSVMFVGGAVCLTFPYIMEVLGEPFIAESPINQTDSTLFQDVHWGMLAVSIIGVLIPFFEFKLVVPTMRKRRAERDEARKIAQEEAVKAQIEAQKAKIQSAPQMPEQDQNNQLYNAAMLQSLAQMKQQEFLNLVSSGSAGADQSNPQLDALAEQVALMMRQMGMDIDDLLSSSDDEEAQAGKGNEDAVRAVFRRASIAELQDPDNENELVPPQSTIRGSIDAVRRASRLGSGCTVLNESSLAVVGAATIITNKHLPPKTDAMEKDSSGEWEEEAEELLNGQDSNKDKAPVITGSRRGADVDDELFQPEGSRNASRVALLNPTDNS